MDYYFFDSSAIVKNYVQELGTNWVKSILNTVKSNVIYVVSITEVEVVSAFARRLKGKTLSVNDASLASTQFKYDFANDFRIIETESSLLKNAVNIAEKHTLRGYYAVQLSAALEISKQITSLQIGFITFVSADNELNIAAKNKGLNIENPNNYP